MAGWSEDGPGTLAELLANGATTGSNDLTVATGQQLLIDSASGDTGLLGLADSDLMVTDGTTGMGNLRANRLMIESDQNGTSRVRIDNGAAAGRIILNLNGSIGFSGAASADSATAFGLNSPGLGRLYLTSQSLDVASRTDVTMLSGGNGGGARTVKVSDRTLTLSTVGATTDLADTIPTNSEIEFVSYYVTTTISGGGVTSWQLGDGTDPDRFIASTTDLTLGDADVSMIFRQPDVAAANGPLNVTGSPMTLTVTCDATPTAGAIRICVWYRTHSAPNSG